jgi:hypothetical protein
MKSNCFRAFFAMLALLIVSSSAFAAPGDLTSVERHCGPPNAESKEISQVTNQLERTLIYNNNGNTLYLHFEPVAGGWSFTTAWKGHLPMTRNELEGRLPCFRNAMQEAENAAKGVSNVDPTIARQTAAMSSEGTFGIPLLWLIVALVITLLIFIFLPSARQRRAARLARKPIEHVYRKPNMDEYIPPAQSTSNREFE